ncbi:hypothetical protein SAMN05216573_110273 [Bradyrhizobium sp. Rc3b]|uniref:hypothetical protein n=1 Tax=unclassified Bradyrhizobium TaxID=2631580 RepID=UPI0008E83FD9|nr:MULTISPECIES: hypothetical protein [unclassified Bradyrhizobium]MBB4380620.1 hypothetical protein [Bradyrhizobium sp. SBR1B]SFN27564.1 hypothetical protein SAMN05216573_110273 [Bradyrhizobium sp. Rc3b]
MTTAMTRNSTTPVVRYGSRPAPRVKLTGQRIAIQHPDAETGEHLLGEALGAVDQDALHGILKQLMKASVILQKPDEDNLAFMISMMKSIAPRDSLETMLTAQMVSVHVATMRFACRLAFAEGIPQQEGVARTLTRLARTFAAQMEALNRHRGNGERPITVQNLSVQDGGSAIVGNVTQQAHLIAAEPGTATEAGLVPPRDAGERDRTEALRGTTA